MQPTVTISYEEYEKMKKQLNDQSALINSMSKDIKQKVIIRTRDGFGYMTYDIVSTEETESKIKESIEHNEKVLERIINIAAEAEKKDKQSLYNLPNPPQPKKSFFYKIISKIWNNK